MEHAEDSVGTYRNCPLDDVRRWALMSVALIVADLWCCLCVQAIVDHVLHRESFHIAPLISHLLCGAVLLTLALRRAKAGEPPYFLTMASAWALTAPIALLLSLGINFYYGFTF